MSPDTKKVAGRITTINGNIRRLRKKKGLSQVALARSVGLSQDRVSKYECYMYVPSSKYLKRLAAALGVSELELRTNKETGEVYTVAER